MGDFTAVVIDFETTGLSPFHGDRTIEVGAVMVSQNQIIDRFQSLMNPRMKISPFIEQYTGITNTMLAAAPEIPDVMRQLREFISGHYLVAHNASFDSKFLDAEFERIGQRITNEFACSMLIARRIYLDAPNHKLETLVQYKSLKTDGIHHRALADAEMTAHLWMGMINDIKAQYRRSNIHFEFMQRLARTPRKKVHQLLSDLIDDNHS